MSDLLCNDQFVRLIAGQSAHQVKVEDVEKMKKQHSNEIAELKARCMSSVAQVWCSLENQLSWPMLLLCACAQ